MKKLFFCFTLFLTIAASGQVDSMEKMNAFNFIDSALNAGNYIFEINDIELPQEYIIIAQKYQRSISANKEWFEKYINEHKEGEGLLYHENLGITKEEYEKMKTMDTAQKQLKIISEQPVAVNKDDGLLTFAGISDFKLLDIIQVDFNNKTMIFAGEHLHYAHSFTTTETSPFGIWTGYVWRKEQINDASAFSQLTGRIIAVTFGKSVASNSLILRIMYKEVKNGIGKVNVDTFGFLK